MPVRALLALSALAMAAVGLSGCAAGGAADTATATAGPLDEYLSVLYPGSDDDEQTIIERVAAIEAAIGACMAAQGFDYVPQPYDPLDYSFPGDWRPDDRDWVSLYGYGTIDFPARDAVMADNATGDENDAYYATLSASDQAAYSLTRWGPELTDAQIEANMQGSRALTWEDQGCWGQGRHEVLGDDPQDDPANASIAQDIYFFQMYQFEAPEYAELDADWSDCMADAGYPGFTRQQDAAQSIEDARYEITVGATEDLAMDVPAYDDLLDHEIELATTDLDCREKVDYRARALAIRFTLEERFVADHRSELDALVAQAEQGE